MSSRTAKPSNVHRCLRGRAAVVSAGFIVASACVAPFDAHAQSACEWYARNAIEQQKLNLEHKCDLGGQAWSLDYRAHLAWCGNARTEEWKRQAQLREQSLAQCMSGRKGG